MSINRVNWLNKFSVTIQDFHINDHMRGTPGVMQITMLTPTTKCNATIKVKEEAQISTMNNLHSMLNEKKEGTNLCVQYAVIPIKSGQRNFYRCIC